MTGYDRVCANIDLDALHYNLEQMYKNINKNTKIMGVIKTDAYGHGALQLAKEMETIDYVCGMALATAEEALILRHCGIKKPLLILGYTFPYAYKELIGQDIGMTVFKWDMVKEINEAAKELKKKAKVHIKVDTAMSRIGVMADNDGMAFIKECLSMEHIEVAGVFTHFAKADELNKEPVMKQLSIFSDFVEKIKKDTGRNDIIFHCSNSAGIVELKEANMDMVRAGITLYGLWPSAEVAKDIVDLKPLLSLKSHVVYVKKLKKGTEISYGGTFIAPKDMLVATIPVGYGDGYPRTLSNKGQVLIRGQRANILGRVCMDQMMVDVSHISDITDGDEVTLIGKDQTEIITMEELGDLSGRFNYELACDLGKRIPRVYYKNGEIVDTKDYFEDYR